MHSQDRDLPNMPEPYLTALHEAVEYIECRYTAVGIAAGGTIMRGVPHDNSDLDIIVVHDAPWRQHVQRRFNSVAAELFINPDYEFRQVMAGEAADGRPAMIHLMSTGLILVDRAGSVQALRDEAQGILGRGPAVPAEIVQRRVYGAATAFEDAVDIVDVDLDRAKAMMSESIINAVEMYFLRRGQWLPLAKALLSELDRSHPALGADVRQALRVSGDRGQLEFVESTVRQLIGQTGFFEWETVPQERLPPS